MAKRPLPTGMRKRGDVYYAWFRSGGELIRKRLSTDLRTATELLNAMRHDADRRKAGHAPPPGDARVVDVQEDWQLWCRDHKRASTARDYQRDVARFLAWANVELCSQITTAMVRKYREHLIADGQVDAKTKKVPGTGRKTPVTTRTINRQVAAISSMLGWAARQRPPMIAGNPLRDLEPLPHETPRKVRRSLEPQEVERLLQVAWPRWRPAWRLLLCSGIRAGELLTLRSCDIDRAKLQLTVRTSIAKARRSRVVAIDQETMDQITPLMGEPSSLLWSTRAGRPITLAYLLKAFRADCKRAGIADSVFGGAIDLHAVRVTFATLSIDSGASPRAVQAQLGHSTMTMTERYTRARTEAQAHAVESLPWVRTRRAQGNEEAAESPQNTGPRRPE